MKQKPAPSQTKMWGGSCSCFTHSQKGEKSEHMAKITISARVEPELKAKLEYISKGSGFSLADHIKAALALYINGFEKNHGNIPQKEVDRRAKEIRT